MEMKHILSNNAMNLLDSFIEPIEVLGKDISVGNYCFLDDYGWVKIKYIRSKHHLWTEKFNTAYFVVDEDTGSLNYFSINIEKKYKIKRCY